MGGVDQGIDALARRDSPRGRRRRRSRRRGPAPAARAGEAVRPASDSVTSRSARPARRPASCRASVVPPRMRMRAMSFKSPLPDAIARDTAASPRWLSIVGIGEDGVEGLSPAARGLIGAAEIVFGGRRHLGLAAPLIRGAARPWPSPFDGAADEVLQPSRPPGLRARLGRSVPLRRRRGAGAPHRCPRNDRRAGAVGLQPGGGAARLVAAADRAPFAARPHARSGAPASAARRAHPGPDLRRRRTRGAGAASDAIGLRRARA